MKPIQEDQNKQQEFQIPQTVNKDSSQKSILKYIYIILGIVILIILFASATYVFFSKNTSIGTPPGPPEPSVQSSTNNSQLSNNCQPDATLVNPCRPWIGAAAHGNPGIPGQTPPGKDAISQFDYLGQLLGRSLDVYRDYHSPLTVHNANSSIPVDPNTTEGQTEIQLSKRPNTYLDINWDPTDTWQQAMAVSQGGDPTINAQIDTTAANIKALSPHTIFLSPWWEANDHISSGTGCTHFNTTNGHGSPSQFVAAWQNIYNHFKADGVTNVIWDLDYASFAPNDCWVPQMWPGSQYVNWVTYDTYSRGKTWQQTAGAFYSYLISQSTNMPGLTTKAWGIGEFGSCKQPANGITDAQYYQSVKQALDTNTYPQLKMYLIYADTGNNSGPGCLTDFDANGTYDPNKQTVFNQLFNDPIFAGTHTPGPTSTVSQYPSSIPTSIYGRGKHLYKHKNQL